jgi:hypothetical protein
MAEVYDRNQKSKARKKIIKTNGSERGTQGHLKIGILHIDGSAVNS